MTDFEDALWERLVEEHDADCVSLEAPRRHASRRPLAIGGGVTALAGATVATVLAIGATTGAPPAYAMTQNADGTFTVTMNEIATAIPALNAKFAQLGIEETVVPVTASCTSHMPLVLGPEKMSDTVTVAPGGKWVPPGYTGVLAAEQLANGQVAMFVGTVKPPVPSCFSATTALSLEPGTATTGTPTLTETTVTPAPATTTAGAVGGTDTTGTAGTTTTDASADSRR
jgi:hypothetical protein